MRELHLFAGGGGGILGGILLGHSTVCAVEINRHRRAALLRRQRDGVLPWFPIWDDVRTFDGRPWRGLVDAIHAGFPCQDVSLANQQGGAGLDGEQSGLYLEALRVVGEVRPGYIELENSPALTTRGLGTILARLAALGYDARWGVLGAQHVGAPHKRERIWILAYSSEAGCKECQHSNLASWPEQWLDSGRAGEARLYWPEAEPPVLRNVDGMAKGLDALAATGDGQVPAVAAMAWRMLSQRID